MAEKSDTRSTEMRQAALSSMARFADKHGASDRNWREEDCGDHARFIGKTDDGREFAIGYVK